MQILVQWKLDLLTQEVELCGKYTSGDCVIQAFLIAKRNEDSSRMQIVRETFTFSHFKLNKFSKHKTAGLDRRQHAMSEWANKNPLVN